MNSHFSVLPKVRCIDLRYWQTRTCL